MKNGWKKWMQSLRYVAFALVMLCIAGRCRIQALAADDSIWFADVLMDIQSQIHEVEELKTPSGQLIVGEGWYLTLSYNSGAELGAVNPEQKYRGLVFTCAPSVCQDPAITWNNDGAARIRVYENDKGTLLYSKIFYAWSDPFTAYVDINWASSVRIEVSCYPSLAFFAGLSNVYLTKQAEGMQQPPTGHTIPVTEVDTGWSDGGSDWSDSGSGWSDGGSDWSDGGSDWSDGGSGWSDGGSGWSGVVPYVDPGVTLPSPYTVDELVAYIRAQYYAIEAYAAANGYASYQTLYTESGNLMRQTFQNGSSLDSLMQTYGYSTYYVMCYYDTRTIIPYARFIYAQLDGQEYRYYFEGNMLARRIYAGSQTDYPVMTDFIWGLVGAATYFPW